jgi:exodeoxyribonuclease VII large subunit
MATDDEFLTVTQLTTYLKRKFDFDPYLTEGLFNRRTV